MKHVRLAVFKDGKDQFLRLLSDNNIPYSKVELFSAGTVLASADIFIVSLVQASAPWVALSAVLVSWIKSRSSRKVIVTTKENVVVHLEGLSVSEVERILEKVVNITVVDTEPDKITKDASSSGP